MPSIIKSVSLSPSNFKSVKTTCGSTLYVSPVYWKLEWTQVNPIVVVNIRSVYRSDRLAAPPNLQRHIVPMSMEQMVSCRQHCHTSLPTTTSAMMMTRYHPYHPWTTAAAVVVGSTRRYNFERVVPRHHVR